MRGSRAKSGLSASRPAFAAIRESKISFNCGDSRARRDRKSARSASGSSTYASKRANTCLHSSPVIFTLRIRAAGSDGRQSGAKIDPSLLPVSADRTGTELHSVGDFVLIEAGEVAHFDDLDQRCVDAREVEQRLVDAQDF